MSPQNFHFPIWRHKSFKYPVVELSVPQSPRMEGFLSGRLELAFSIHHWATDYVSAYLLLRNMVNL